VQQHTFAKNVDVRYRHRRWPEIRYVELVNEMWLSIDLSNYRSGADLDVQKAVSVRSHLRKEE